MASQTDLIARADMTPISYFTIVLPLVILVSVRLGYCSGLHLENPSRPEEAYPDVRNVEDLIPDSSRLKVPYAPETPPLIYPYPSAYPAETFHQQDSAPPSNSFYPADSTNNFGDSSHLRDSYAQIGNYAAQLSEVPAMPEYPGQMAENSRLARVSFPGDLSQDHVILKEKEALENLNFDVFPTDPTAVENEGTPSIWDVILRTTVKIVTKIVEWLNSY